MYAKKQQKRILNKNHERARWTLWNGRQSKVALLRRELSYAAKTLGAILRLFGSNIGSSTYAAFYATLRGHRKLCRGSKRSAVKYAINHWDVHLCAGGWEELWVKSGCGFSLLMLALTSSGMCACVCMFVWVGLGEVELQTNYLLHATSEGRHLVWL